MTVVIEISVNWAFRKPNNAFFKSIKTVLLLFLAFSSGEIELHDVRNGPNLY